MVNQIKLFAILVTMFVSVVSGSQRDEIERYYKEIEERFAKERFEKLCKALKNYAGYDRMIVDAAQMGTLTPELIKLAVSTGTNINGNFCTYRDCSPILFFAIHNENSLKILINAKADIHARSKTWDNQTPLHFASRWNNTTSAKLLLDLNADINSLDARNNTPLNAAIHQREIVKFLLENKASIEYCNNEDYGSLFYAATLDFPLSRTVQELLNAEADYNFINKANKTCLMVIKEKKEALNWGIDHFETSENQEKRYNCVIEIFENHANAKIKNTEIIIEQTISLPIPLIRLMARLAFGLIED